MDDGAFPGPENPVSTYPEKGMRIVRLAKMIDIFFLDSMVCPGAFIPCSSGNRLTKPENSTLIVVNELLDGIDRLVDFRPRVKKAVRQGTIIWVQTLHPFGKENYTGVKLFQTLIPEII